MTVLLFIAFAACTSIYQAFIVTTLWWWFAVPMGLPLITIPTAIGAGLVLALLAPKAIFSETLSAAKMETNQKMTAALTYGIVAPTLALFVGWIAHSFQ